MRLGRPLMVVTLAFSLIFLLSGTEAGEVRVLYLGDPFGSSPYFALSSEPDMYVYPVPSFTMAGSYPEHMGSRMMRRYFPRDYESLAGYHAIILSDVRSELLSGSNIEWIRESVIDSGLGVAMIGGLDSFTGVGERSWYATPLGELLPVTGGAPHWANTRLVWIDTDDALISSLPFDQLLDRPLFAGYNEVSARLGARSVAVMRSEGITTPLMAYWQVGRGTVFAFSSEWKGDSYATFCRTPEECHLRGTRWGNDFAAWQYSPDFARNLVYLLAGKPYPEDPDATHLYRSRTGEYSLMKSLATLQIEFVDKLGLQTRSLEGIVQGADAAFEEAENLYAGGRIADSLASLDRAIELLSALNTEASRVQESGKVWLRIVLYGAVAGAAMMSGLVIDLAMLKARRE